MAALTALLPDGPANRPPVILIHGAANSALVWTFWQRELVAAGWATYALDLRGHGRQGENDPIDLSRTSMHDYASDVRALTEQLARRPVLVGWSMGGLVALMGAASGLASACVALAPSLPARAEDPSIEPRAGEFGPEEYGITSRDPNNQPAMPDLDARERAIALASLGRESRLARDERRRGIVVERLSCPLLLITGSLDLQWSAERYDAIWLEADRLEAEGASHWGLVLNRRAITRLVPSVLAWLCGASAV